MRTKWVTLLGLLPRKPWIGAHACLSGDRNTQKADKICVRLSVWVGVLGCVLYPRRSKWTATDEMGRSIRVALISINRHFTLHRPENARIHET